MTYADRYFWGRIANLSEEWEVLRKRRLQSKNTCESKQVSALDDAQGVALKEVESLERLAPSLYERITSTC